MTLVTFKTTAVLQVCEVSKVLITTLEKKAVKNYI